MNSLKALVKVEFYSFFKINLLSKSNKNKKQRAEKAFNACIYVLLIILACVGVIVMTSFAISYELAYLLFPALTIIVFAIVFLFMIMNQFTLYGRKDYDMLISLPVKLSKIVFAKLSVFLAQSILISFIFYLPSGITYGISYNETILFYIKLIVISVVTPLLPFVLSVFIGAVFSYIATSISSNLSKNMKIFWNVVSGLILALIVVAGVYSSVNYTKYVNADLIDSIVSDLTNGNIIAKLVNDILYEGNNLTLIIYIVFCCAAFVLSMIIFAYFFPRINQRMMLRTGTGNFDISTLKGSSQLKAMINIEAKRYFSISIYVFNTLGFAIFSLILTVVILFVSPVDLLQLLEVEEISAEMVNKYFHAFLPVFTVLTLLLNNTTNASISIEGDNFWHTTCLPISPSTIYKAKLYLNLILFVPIGLISAITFSIKFDLELLGYIALFLTPIAGILFSALIGLWLNLKFPNFEYQNPVEVVKAGTPIIGSILLGLVLIIILFYVAAIFSNAGILIVDGILLICSYIIWINIKSIPVKSILAE